jgi:Kef-type K+ transport system membrane component KefB
MRLGRREDGDHRATRVVVWSDESETDVGVLVAMGIAAVICISSVVIAISFDGLARVIAVVLAGLSGLYFAVLAIPLWLAGRLFRWVRRRYLE